MNDLLERFIDIIPKHMTRRGLIAFEALVGPLRDILNRRQFPDHALSEIQVEWLLRLLSSLDSDKDPKAARVGEREARIASPLVARLSMGFNHGIGRSGHVTAPQPKAAGASLMQQLCNTIATDAIRQLGLPNIKDGVVLPLSTGMSIALAFGTLRKIYGVKKVLYPRIDHTSPQRGLELAGVEVIQVPTILDDDAVKTDMGKLEQYLDRLDETAVLATTTFFPPRESDPVKDIARLCANHDIPLVINNAYGVQSESVMHSIRSAIDAGHVSLVIQSSDKNFLTPVGGAIVVSPHKGIIEEVAKTYAGRATAAPIVQLLASLLLLGKNKYQQLRCEQIENRTILEARLREKSEKIGQRILDVENPISCAITLDGHDAHKIGARLYNNRVTGPRAVAAGERGSCIDRYPHSYIVMNAAIGAGKGDIEKATTKLFKGFNSE